MIKVCKSCRCYAKLFHFCCIKGIDVGGIEVKYCKYYKWDEGRNK